ncbi:MAG: hypothetical protein H6628_10220 [Calditrichae bacterium]|nr:hypothetical protein [Calditrichia bacterium]
MQKSGIDNLFHSAHERLLAVTRQYYLLQVLHAVMKVIFLGLALLLLFVLLALVFDPAPVVRGGFWVLLTVVAIYFLARHILPDLRRAFRPNEGELYAISKQIGRHNLEVQDALINFLQIYRDQGTPAHSAFKNLSLKQLYEKFRATHFSNILSPAILKHTAGRLLTAFTVLLLLLLIFPASVSQAMLKVVYPTRSFEDPLPLTLKNLSGEMTALKNASVELRGAYEGVAPQKLWLVVQSQSPTADSIQTERLELNVLSGKNFVYPIHHVKTSFTYWFEGSIEHSSFRNRLAVSERGRVLVKDRPFIRELQVKLTFPPYTGLSEVLLPPNNGEITALAGTAVGVEVLANKSLAQAWIRFRDSSKVELTVQENRAQGQFAVTRDDQYQIQIQDRDGIVNYQPVQYSVFALSDEHPFVEIAKPGEDLDLGDELEVPLLINLRDDFGFSKLLLKGHHIRAGSKGDTVSFSQALPYQKIDQNRAISDYRWDISGFFLIPEDYIEYYAEVYDNDVITGPKFARSKTFVLRLPSMMEILQNAEERAGEQLENTEDVAQQTRELKEKLEEINREMKREDELSWERKQQIQEQMEKQQQSMDRLKDVQQQLEELVKDLDAQDMLSPETLEKYFELQKMFQEMASEELQEAMKKLQDALEKTDMDEVKQAMEQFQLSMEEFEQRIERTYELFKRVEMEQKMDQLAKMAEKLAEEQSEINQELGKENPDETLQEQLTSKEQNLEKNTDFFESQLQEAVKDFQEQMAETAQDLQQAQEFMDQQQLQSQMQQMQQQMQGGQQQQAQKSGQKLEQQLQMLQSMMQQAQSNMNNAQKQEVMQAMEKAQNDMLRASFQQEQLMDNTSQINVASPQITDIARRQSQMQENTNQIIQQVLDISKQTFFMSPQMNQVLSEMREEMDRAIQSLENRNLRNAAQSQQKAMASLNQAIMQMQSAMNQLQMAGSASGFEEMMQQLQQMAGQQGQLNQQSMGMFQQQGQGKMQLSSEGMARLAAQQEMIRQSLEKMNQQHGGGNQKDMLGRLGELGEEMEKVIDDLQKQNLNRSVIERQQRILSRMLDAQKSVREREYSRKRQSEREDNVLAKSPPEIKQELLERENKLRKEMLDALKEGYSPEYREFIKSYYEILSRQPQPPAP